MDIRSQNDILLSQPQLTQQSNSSFTRAWQKMMDSQMPSTQKKKSQAKAKTNSKVETKGPA